MNRKLKDEKDEVTQINMVTKQFYVVDLCNYSINCNAYIHVYNVYYTYIDIINLIMR